MSENKAKKEASFLDDTAHEIEERVVTINRSAKTVKGGRNFSFGALVVVGDHHGKVGYGFAKANEVADAVKKAVAAARANMFSVELKGQTIPHEIQVKSGGSQVLIKPASEGTGLKAGGGMRAVLELAGVRDALCKSFGSSNAINLVKATIKAVQQLQSRDTIMTKRGLK